jgi:hypothetical protein
LELVAGCVKIDGQFTGTIEGTLLQFENCLIIFDSEMVVRYDWKSLSSFVFLTDVARVVLNLGFLPETGVKLVLLDDLLMKVFSHLDIFVFVYYKMYA